MLRDQEGPMRRNVALALIVATAFVGASVAAQSKHTPGRWTPPRTPDGQPDMQGIWTNATITPFERPANLRDKAFLTEAEAEAFERQAATRREEDGPPRPGDVGSYNQFWFDSGDRVVSTRRTSLVIEPPDGRVPLRPEAEAARNYTSAHEGDSYEFMSVWDRCITRGAPGGMFPAGYNNAYQIVQTPGHVVIHYEMIHEARIIPTDGGRHLPAHVRLWNGDPRGRWEGSTLVVDTTNYNSKGWIATQAAAGRIKGIPQTESLHVVERLTPIDANTIEYETTIDDPSMFTRPWTVSIPLHRDPTYRIYEYACHEGNRAVEGVLRGARAQETPK
ncbi:MAG: hypothetical protein DMF97_12295 [Acidobacteria bacterium]|nr:MAG: hypothetical protein DMF97_12295 [Acidobacteriota bacterium]